MMSLEFYFVQVYEFMAAGKNQGARVTTLSFCG
jgi:hypothetical protein